jgi:YD repeat-containing protein
MWPTFAIHRWLAIPTDAAGTATTNTYDANGNLTQVSTPLVGSAQNRVVIYTHGNALHPGDVTQMTDADGKIWTYGYDQYGNRNAVTDPLTDKTTYVFDSASRLTSMVTPKGNVTGANPSQCSGANSTYAYDGDGLRMSKTTLCCSDSSTGPYSSSETRQYMSQTDFIPSTTWKGPIRRCSVASEPQIELGMEFGNRPNSDPNSRLSRVAAN